MRTEQVAVPDLPCEIVVQESGEGSDAFQVWSLDAPKVLIRSLQPFPIPNGPPQGGAQDRLEEDVAIHD